MCHLRTELTGDMNDFPHFFKWLYLQGYSELSVQMTVKYWKVNKVLLQHDTLCHNLLQQN